MTDQLTLDGKPDQPTVKLSDRQRFALDLIRELGPIPSDELGAHMHERRGKHSSAVRCEWCASEGKAVGGELRKKGLVKHRREEGWVVPVGAARAGGYDPRTSEIPY